MTSDHLQHDLRPDPRFRVDLQQQRVRDAAVDDVGFVHAALERGDAGFDFRQHAGGDDAGLDHVVDLGGGEVADAAFGVFRVRADAVGVGDDDEFFRAHGGGDGAGGGVGVDVQLPAGVVARDRGDAGD